MNTPKILIVKLTSMGDILFSMPVVADLHKKFPGAMIDWAVDSNFADLPKAFAGINRVYTFPFRKNRPLPGFQGVRAAIAEILALRTQRYDVVIDMQGMVKSGLISLLAKGEQKWGYRRQELAERFFFWVYNKTMSRSAEGHVVDRYRSEIGQVINQPPQGSAAFSYRLPKSDLGVHENSLISRASLGANGYAEFHPVLMLFPFASTDRKEIQSELVLSIIQLAISTGYTVVLPSGSPREAARARSWLIDARVKLLPRQEISSLMTQISKSAVFIGADTGLTHVAASLGVRTIAIFRVKNSQSLGPHLWARSAVSLDADDTDLLEKVDVVLSNSLGAPPK